jgi:hypothetical protein
MDNNALNILSRKAGFNTALRHFRTITAYVGEIQQGANLADLLTADLEDGAIERYQLRPTINALLVDKFGYACRAHNLDETIEEADAIADTLAKWTNIQIVFVYHHPQAGTFVLNPKIQAAWESVLPLMKDELLVAYVGSVDGEASDDVLEAALADAFGVLYGKKVKPKKAYVAAEEGVAAKTPEPAPKKEAAPAQPRGKRRMTPRYSVLVTNELFHNGNVEAWKRIIESYKAKYPGLDVLIWYENERINDINALFKWGKVKHGTPILVSVVGDDIKGVSKLQRYLYEGASPRFEVFLKGGVDRTLDLF